jgi:hypothetical protein
MRVAALFVRRTSHYKAMPDVDCYDYDRDALTFQGGCPGVYHPPCRSWGKLSHFAKPQPGERELAHWSVHMVRTFGGVVEHPKDSRLWAESHCGTYGVRDRWGGLLVPVFQSWWGHKAPKATCFYVVGASVELPPYIPPRTIQSVERMSQACREVTPPELATWLINTARSCGGLQ